MRQTRKGKEHVSYQRKKYDGDYFQTRINATIEEVAHYYFPISEIKEIEILQGGDEETDSYIKTPYKIYRVSKEEQKEYNLYCNIRVAFGIFYKGTEETKKMSCGLVRI